jgi:hypothetical protein
MFVSHFDTYTHYSFRVSKVTRNEEFILHSTDVVMIVPPAELESTLLQHPDVADAGVIGVNDPSQATELPRCVLLECLNAHLIFIIIFSPVPTSWLRTQRS